jgi:hypothetical protein
MYDDNFLDDRIPRTFVRPGVGFFSGLSLMKRYNVSRATAMRGSDMPALTGPFEGQSHFLSVNFDRDMSTVRQPGERRNRTKTGGHEEEEDEEEDEEGEGEGMLGEGGGFVEEDEEERERIRRMRELEELEEEEADGGTSTFIKRVRSCDPETESRYVFGLSRAPAEQGRATTSIRRVKSPRSL